MSEKRRPLSITLIAIRDALSVLAVPFALQHPMMLFGFQFTGVVGQALHLASAALCLYLAIGLWGLREHARKLAIAWEAFVTVNAWVCYPLIRRTAEQIIRDHGYGGVAPVAPMVAGLVGASVLSLVVIAFLIRRQDVFRDS